MLLYRLLLTLAAPLVAFWFALRLLRQRETRADLRERLGLDGPSQAPDGPVIWLHGASNGELTSARDLIETLLRRDPRLRIIVTSNSLTGRDMVRGWNLRNLRARLAPIDYRACLTHFIDRHKPRALLLLEGDLWPNRMVVSAARGIPVAMISARISERSAGRWGQLGQVTSAMLDAVTHLSAQDAASEQRFRDLGLSAEAVGPQFTLKATVALPSPDPVKLESLGRHLSRADTLLAASTHEGEEEQVIAAFKIARAVRPALKMILAPRHPARSADVAELLEAAGLHHRTRSAGEEPTPDCDVYLADTLGEMPLWYALSGQCFVGGSLVRRGGHTPYEPAQFDCAILHGPDTSNFAEQYSALSAAGGAIMTADADALGIAIAGLNAPERTRLALAAIAALGLDGAKGLSLLINALATKTGMGSLHSPPRD